MTPGRIGRPAGDGVQSSPSKRSSASLAKRQHSSPWLACRMLTQNRPLGSMSGQLFEFRPGKKPTRGGSSETDANEPIVRPFGCPSTPSPVITVTPVGKCPSTRRNWVLSKLATTRTVRAIATADLDEDGVRFLRREHLDPEALGARSSLAL